MKNWRFKIVLAFFACLLFFGFNSFKVEAAEQAIGNEVVMFLGVVEETNSGTFNGVSVVSQKYYKSSGDSKPNRKNGYDSLSLVSICSISDVTLAKYCHNGDLNSTLAYLMVDDTGNILVNLSNGVTIESLYIAYIIAGNNDNDDTKWLMKNNAIKEKAKRIKCDNTGSWLCLHYNEETAKSAFSVNALAGSGGFNYRNFNIFSKMDSTYKTVAREQGLYVAISLQVKYGTAVYKVNTSTVPSSGSHDFSTIDTGSAKLLSVNDTGGWVAVLAQAASLVAVDDTKSSGLENNEVYKRFNDVFKKYVRPIAIAVLGIMFIVTGSTTVLTIVRSSDEPEVRSSSIKRLVILFTSSVVIFLILIFYEPVISVVYGWFN